MNPKAKSKLKSFGTGILNVGNAIGNSTIRTQIAEIDEQLEELNKKTAELNEARAALVERLVPYI